MTKRIFVNHNGQIKDGATEILSVHNRVFRYADGFFETIRMINGKLMFFQSHFLRIEKAMEILQFVVPDFFTQEYLHSEIMHLFRVNKIMKSGVARIAFSRLAEGRYFVENEQGIEFLIETFSEEAPQYQLNKKGLHIGVYEENPKCINALSEFKTGGGSQVSILGALFAKNRDYDDVLLTNVNGELIEATSSNVFFVKNDILYTPSVDSGCVNGIMRQAIIDLALKFHYTVLDEAVIYKMQLTDFDEIFLTNAVSGIRWVLAYDEKRYFNNVSRRLIEALNE